VGHPQYQINRTRSDEFPAIPAGAGGLIKIFINLHLILPFDTPLVFWGIFWLKREKAKVHKSL
jgi:hypothetical protein